MSLREHVAAACEAGLQAADARDSVLSFLRNRDFRPGPSGRLVVAGWGKAALPMLHGAVAALAARGLAPDAGLVVVKRGQAEGAASVGAVSVREAAHPVPDETSARAGRDLLELASSLRRGDALLALSSGGGTSLLATPIEPASLADLQATWERLLRDGTGIAEANGARRLLSATADGRLARAAGEARSLTLVVSDVPGDDPRLVASGPMALDGCEHVVVARNGDAVRAAANELERRGFRVESLEGGLTGDASAAAAEIAGSLRAACERAAPGIARVGLVGIVLGGETTVRVTGALRGGRNGHLAACAALRLSENPISAPWALAAIATDGDDGSSGTAGALVDDSSQERWRRAGLDARDSIARCDSLSLLRASGDAVSAASARTNVADLVVAVAERA